MYKDAAHASGGKQGGGDAASRQNRTVLASTNASLAGTKSHSINMLALR